eukprot:PhM_4_TR18076/c5_g4_i1/m.44709
MWRHVRRSCVDAVPAVVVHDVVPQCRAVGDVVLLVLDDAKQHQRWQLQRDHRHRDIQRQRHPRGPQAQSPRRWWWWWWLDELNVVVVVLVSVLRRGEAPRAAAPAPTPACERRQQQQYAAVVPPRGIVEQCAREPRRVALLRVARGDAARSGQLHDAYGVHIAHHLRPGDPITALRLHAADGTAAAALVLVQRRGPSPPHAGRVRVVSAQRAAPPDAAPQRVGFEPKHFDGGHRRHDNVVRRRGALPHRDDGVHDVDNDINVSVPTQRQILALRVGEVWRRWARPRDADRRHGFGPTSAAGHAARAPDVVELADPDGPTDTVVVVNIVRTPSVWCCWLAVLPRRPLPSIAPICCFSVT